MPNVANKTAFNAAMQAYAKLKKTNPSINPFLTHVVVDIGASTKFASAMVEKCPTLTRSRASQFGYWDSVKGGPLSLNDMCKLQGFHAHQLDWDGVAPSQVAGCLGNGISVAVMNRILPDLFFVAGKITKAQLNLLRQRAEIHRLSLATE
jgi:hypothetical protein